MNKTFWWMKPQRVLQPILVETDGQTDMKCLVRNAWEEGYTALLLNAGGMFAWYPTQISFHVNPAGMRGDPLGEAIAEAHALDLRVMIRFDLSGLREDAYQAHPEWFYMGADGKPMIDKGMYATCLSTPFLDEFFFPMFEEILAKYDFDGVFFNMFGYRDTDRRGIYHGPCHCPYCQSEFARQYHQPLPRSTADASWEQYREYREKMFEKASERVFGLIKSKSEDIAFLDGRGPRAAYSLARGLGDVAELELHWSTPNPRVLPSVPEQKWPYAAGECARSVRTLDQQFSVMVNAYQCGGGRLQGHSEGWNLFVLSQAIANGAWPYLAFTGVPWKYASQGREAVVNLLQKMRRQDDCLQGLRSTARTVVVTSDTALREDHDGVYLSALRGVYRSLVTAHVEFDLLDADYQEAGQLLKKYDRIVVLPIPVLSQAFCAMVDRLVAEGRALVVFGCREEWEKETVLSKPRFDAVGVERLIAQRDVSNAFAHVQEDKVLSINGLFQYAQVKADATTDLPLISEIEYASPEQEIFTSDAGWPGLIRMQYEKGTSVYVPWELPRLAHLFAQEGHVALLSEILAPMEEKRLLETDAPCDVEVTLHYQPETDRYIVQFVNGYGRNGMEFRKPPQIENITVRINAPDCVCAVQPGRGKLQTLSDNESIRFILPRLEQYELVWIGRRKGGDS